jgi:hypothetical protein
MRRLERAIKRAVIPAEAGIQCRCPAVRQPELRATDCLRRLPPVGTMVRRAICRRGNQALLKHNHRGSNWMSRTALTWQLMKSSWHVLMRDKSLLVFPLVSGVCCLLVMATFLVPTITLFGSVGGTFHGTSDVTGYALLFGFYVCTFFVIYFCNAALIDFVVTRVRGGEPTVRDSLRAAIACLPQIALWSIVSSTIGTLLKIIESRSGFLGRIVTSLVGLAWTLVTYFVVPMIVIERKGALEAIGESKDLLRKTWGQQVVGGLGYGLIGFLLALPAIALIVVGFVGLLASGFSHMSGYAALIVVALLYFVALGIVMSALQAIFGAVLYMFARTGKTPAGYDATALRQALTPA